MLWHQLPNPSFTIFSHPSLELQSVIFFLTFLSSCLLLLHPSNCWHTINQYYSQLPMQLPCNMSNKQSHLLFFCNNLIITLWYRKVKWLLFLNSSTTWLWRVVHRHSPQRHIMDLEREQRCIKIHQLYNTNLNMSQWHPFNKTGWCTRGDWHPPQPTWSVQCNIPWDPMDTALSRSEPARVIPPLMFFIKLYFS